jgi:glycosyltransferase involved in cell wall biosynthesis
MVPKILFVANVDWFFISHRLHLVGAAREAGFEVEVAAASTGRSAEIESAGAIFYPLRLSRAGTNPIREIRAAYQISKCIRRSKADLVHLVGIKPVVFGILAVSIMRRRPAVIAAFSGFGHVFEGAASPVLRRSILTALRMLLRRSGAVAVVQNEDARRQLVAWRVADSERVILIEGSGVDTEVFCPVSRKGGSPLRVTMSGRLISEKGLDEYLEAAKLCAAAGVKVRFTLAGLLDLGGNPTAWTAEDAMTRCRDAGVDLRLNVSDMPGLLQETDIFVHASYTEGLSKSLLEAASCGLALVATDIPGNRPVVVDNQTGLLVKARSAESIASAVAALAAAPLLRSSLGAAARTLATNRFSTQVIQGKTRDLWSAMQVPLAGVDAREPVGGTAARSGDT